MNILAQESHKVYNFNVLCMKVNDFEIFALGLWFDLQLILAFSWFAKS